MKKATMQYLLDMMNYEIGVNGGEKNTAHEYVAVRDEIQAELNRNAEKAAANRELYESAKSVVFEGFRVAGTPVTIAELYEEIKDKLPQGFSKSKVQYAVTRLWSDEIIKTEGKTNTYTVKAE